MTMKRHRRRYGSGRYGRRGPGRYRRYAKRQRSRHLYQNKDRAVIFGVCAGIADYLGQPTWLVRLCAIVLLLCFPVGTFIAYLIATWLMDEKPYYRRVTDRFDEVHDRDWADYHWDDPNWDGDRDEADWDDRDDGRHQDQGAAEGMNEGDRFRAEAVKSRFRDIEERLRRMETHVTSSRFELQREFKKMSEEDN